MDKPQQRISVDLDQTTAEGVYANLALITHSPSEFIIDFARMLPGMAGGGQFGAKGKIFARIVMTPQNAKALHKTLGVNIDRYENSHGEIKLPGKDGASEIGFQTGE